MKARSLMTIAAATIALTLAGCAKNMDTTAEGGADGMGGAYGSPVTTSSALGLSPIFPGTKNLSPEDQERLETRVFYFDYDSNQVREEYYSIVRAHALNLIENPSVHVRVEGHTDERGSREYNIALGERRAQAILNVLLMEGANRNQISLVSYGSEKPAVPGYDESAWQYNRRAVIVYEAG